MAIDVEHVPKKVVVRRYRPNAVYRKKTLRAMSPTTRELARLIGESASVNRRLKALLEDVKQLEAKDIARREEMETVMHRLTENKT